MYPLLYCLQSSTALFFGILFLASTARSNQVSLAHGAWTAASGHAKKDSPGEKDSKSHDLPLPSRSSRKKPPSGDGSTGGLPMEANWRRWHCSSVFQLAFF